MLTSTAQEELYEMVKAIYNHLGLDGKRPSSMDDVQEQAEREVVLRRLRELLDESRGTFARKSLHLAPKYFQKLTECVTFVRNAGIFFLQNSLNHSRRTQ